MTASEVIRIAQAEIGYMGKKSNKALDDPKANTSGKYTKYARDLAEAGYYNGSKQSYDYCAVFVDWCVYEAAGRDKELAMATKPTNLYGAGVKWAYKAYEDAGREIDIPVPGCQIFFRDGTSEWAHTGLVVAVTDASLTTVEGNIGNNVVTRTYAKNAPSIVGYGLPYYDDEPKPSDEIKVGDIVRLKPGAHAYTANGIDRGYGFSSWVYDSDLIVGEINSTVAHISTDMTLESYTGWAALTDLTKVEEPDDDLPPDDVPEDDGAYFYFPQLGNEDEGEEWAVLLLQERLDCLGYPGNKYRLTIDGIYGDETIKAVNRFKEDHVLEADGIVDAATWDALLHEKGV